MRECRTSGSVRGVPSNGHPYRNRAAAFCVQPSRARVYARSHSGRSAPQDWPSPAGIARHPRTQHTG